MTATTDARRRDLAAGDQTPDLDALEKVARAASAYPVALGEWRRPRSIQIWAPSLKGGEAHVADMRGWGYLTGGGHGALGLDETSAAAHQDALGDHIATFRPATVLRMIAELRRYREADDAGLLRVRARQMENSRKVWVLAADRALGAIPGASNSTHPAYDLWLRVEMAKAPPMEIVLSTEAE